MFKRLATALWGDLSSDEWKKFLSLGGIFGLIIGTYWSMRPLKDSLFIQLVGINSIPWAKGVSFCVIIPLILVYGKALSRFPREKMFYALCTIYGSLALIMAAFMNHSVYGISGSDPSHFLGYAWYVYIESFGSLLVALFWAFTSDITLPESAKKGFYIVTLLGQVGGMIGPYLLRAKRYGFQSSVPIILMIGLLILFIAIAVRLFVRFTPREQLKGYSAAAEKEEKGEPGFLEGLKLLLSQPYLLAIFGVIAFYEMIVTVLDFRFKILAHSVYPAELDYSECLQNFAVAVNTVAFLSILFGISNIQRRLGLSVSLALLPILIGSAVLVLKFSPVLSVAFAIMVAAKAINYALNGPSLKQLYIPTSADTKYKAGAWIEMFGSRGAKLSGSGVNMLRGTFLVKYGLTSGDVIFMALSAYVSLGFIVFWFFITLFLGRTHKKAIQENKIIC